ncbi:NnrS family protein [Herbaspirillum sp. LeCh32-8]|uniref:NnrS family protein n=1 Tax=Herbaspirillum sp. LeCh32-8 TaxID=2821356 RepID=UPI001AE315E6|nr:NnrS family protein [Herbaspirillum sp. LeCh32-8]MBP0597778.1 NnrS family protein [Herbaspirillum sp. LeCh32-8]
MNHPNATWRQALLTLAFRPFFLLGSLWAAVSIILWMGMLHGGLILPSRFDPLSWHIHEMLFGWILAAVAGFLLTAIPNWTGRPPVRGAMLGALAVVWLLGRIVGAVSLYLPWWLAAAVDVAFPAMVCTLAWREIVGAGNRRNLPMPIPVALLGVASLLMHLQQAGVDLGIPIADGLGWRLAMAAVSILIAVIGARIIPAFTRNWLTAKRIQAQPTGSRALDIAATATLHGGLLAWAMLPQVRAIGLLLLAAAALNLWRTLRWAGRATLGEPLLAILHLGYLWLVAGAALLGLSQLGMAWLQVAAIHALTAGAMGTMVLGVMTRVSLGHTGRPLAADRMTTGIYIAVSAAALCRIGAALLPAPLLLSASAACWTLAFLMFVARYGAVLLQPRLR